MCLPQFLPQFLLKGNANEGSLGPILRGLVVPSLLENNVRRNPGEKGLIVITCEGVKLRYLILDQLVLEADMQLQFESLGGTCGQRALICSAVVTELNDLVCPWEFNQRGKGAHELQSTFLHICRVNFFVKFAVQDSVLSGFDGSEAHGS